MLTSVSPGVVPKKQVILAKKGVIVTSHQIYEAHNSSGFRGKLKDPECDPSLLLSSFSLHCSGIAVGTPVKYKEQMIPSLQ